MPPSPPTDYPRPDFQRKQTWESLNGPWDFAFDDSDDGLTNDWHLNGLPEQGKRTIQVPYVFQTPASGINEGGVHEVLWYQRTIKDPRKPDEAAKKNRVLLRFGAVDYQATVWIDGHLVGEHRGGHVPFDLDITDTIARSNGSARLTLRVYDSATDVTQPRGKQYWGPVPESIFYTPSSGIWQSVWLESVPNTRIADSSHGTILRSDDIEGGVLNSLVSIIGRRAGQKYSVQLTASFAGLQVAYTSKSELPNTKRIALSVNTRLSREHVESLPKDVVQSAPLDDNTCWLNGVALWTPEHPQLYDITIGLFDASDNLVDEVHTTTGMRSISWTNGDGTFRLNGHPYFQTLFLDQGYWPDTQMTPPSGNALRDDILLAKAMGFNGCRKHQKVEDPLFFYWADRLGFLVWGEMASAYRFSKEYVERFDQEWMEMVARDMNHPCVVAWTPANESWAYEELERSIDQRNHLRSLYYRTKTLDPTRPINDNCGWEHVTNDLTTFHDYADARGMAERCASLHSVLSRGKAVFLPEIPSPTNPTPLEPATSHRPGAPVICSEFGGVNIAAGGKDEHHERGWGYTTARNSEDLLARIDDICTATVKTGHVCGFVWTQLTDIEQETNGLYTFDRREKLPAAKVKAVMQKAANAYLSQHFGARDMHFRGNLQSTTRNVRLEEERWLVAECAADASGEVWRPSRLDLNDCVTNTWGNLNWARGGNFKASARNVRLAQGGMVLEAEAGDGSGWLRNEIRLEERIGNHGGVLTFV